MSAQAVTPLHCRRVGQGPDLVLLHGWGLHAGIWEPVIAPLSARFRLHLYDLPGHGCSVAMQDFTLDDVCAALAETAPAHAHWLGWSLGGMVALAFASRYPQRVARLALAASNPRFTTADDWPHAMAPEVLEAFANALGEDYVATLNRFLGLVARGAPDNTVLRTLRQAMKTAPAPTSAGLRSGLDILRTADLRDRLPVLAMPTLLLAGAHDTLVPVAALRALAERHPHVQLREFAQAGHAPFISHPQEFVAALEAFCA